MSTATLEPNKTTRVGVPRGNRRGWIPLVSKFLFWQIVAVLFVESVLYCAGLGEEEIFKLDPVLGSRHMCNKRVTWRSEGFAQSYLNADGLREPELTVAKPAGCYRIALLGDSLTESLQVPYEESFGRLLESKLNAESGQKIQVLNFGTSGYSTAQEYLQLKEQVMKYKPDLVLVCYNSRDIFENWSPADQVITNVRPIALHLPGGNLVVDSSSVTLWMRSPRARILKQCEWLRENSRLWGFLSAIELDLSLHNEPYRFVLTFLTKPGKAIRELTAAGKDFYDKEVNRLSQHLPALLTPTNPSASLSPTDHSVGARRDAPVVAAPETPKDKPVDTQKIYRDLVVRTLGSLFVEMKKECAKIDAEVAIVALPVRSTLCPTPGMDVSFNNYKYEQEIEMLKGICADKKIPLFNCEEQAELLPVPQREKLFFAVHYSPAGQDFVARQLSDFVRRYTDPAESLEQ